MTDEEKALYEKISKAFRPMVQITAAEAQILLNHLYERQRPLSPTSVKYFVNEHRHGRMKRNPVDALTMCGDIHNFRVINSQHRLAAQVVTGNDCWYACAWVDDPVDVMPYIDGGRSRTQSDRVKVIKGKHYPRTVLALARAVSAMQNIPGATLELKIERSPLHKSRCDPHELAGLVDTIPYLMDWSAVPRKILQFFKVTGTLAACVTYKFRPTPMLVSWLSDFAEGAEIEKGPLLNLRKQYVERATVRRVRGGGSATTDLESILFRWAMMTWLLAEYDRRFGQGAPKLPVPRAGNEWKFPPVWHWWTDP